MSSRVVRQREQARGAEEAMGGGLVGKSWGEGEGLQITQPRKAQGDMGQQCLTQSGGYSP